jgi:hypothetical protein
MERSARFVAVLLLRHLAAAEFSVGWILTANITIISQLRFRVLSGLGRTLVNALLTQVGSGEPICCDA